MGGDLDERPVLHDMAVLDDHHPIGEGVRIDRIVCHQDGRAPEPAEMPAQLATDLDAGAGVERRQRLVEQQQLRLGRKRPRQRHALRLATGQFVGSRSFDSVATDPAEPMPGLLVGLRLGDTAGPQPERHVLEHRHVREQQVLLEHHPARALLRRHEHARRRIVDHLAVDLDRAALDRQQAGEATQDGRLAGAVGTEQGDDLARRGVQPHVEAQRSAGDHDVGTRRSSRGALSPAQPSVAQRDEDSEGDGDHQQRDHDRLLRVGVEREVHRQRQRLRLAGEAAGERDASPRTRRTPGPTTAPRRRSAPSESPAT